MCLDFKSLTFHIGKLGSASLLWLKTKCFNSVCFYNNKRLSLEMETKKTPISSNMYLFGFPCNTQETVWYWEVLCTGWVILPREWVELLRIQWDDNVRVSAQGPGSRRVGLSQEAVSRSPRAMWVARAFAFCQSIIEFLVGKGPDQMRLDSLWCWE